MNTPWLHVVAQDLYAIRCQVSAMEPSDNVRQSVELIVKHAMQCLDIVAADLQDVAVKHAGTELPSDGYDK